MSLKTLTPALLASLLLAAACGGDGTPPAGDAGPADTGLADTITDGTGGDTLCSLTVDKINGKVASAVSKVSSRDDQDANKAGVQVDIDVAVAGGRDGLQVTLDVDGATPAPKAAASGGIAAFKGVTLPAGKALVKITPGAPGCTGSTYNLNVQLDPTCTFTAPKDGATLTSKDDKNAATATLDYDVQLTTKSALGGSLTLTINKAPQGSRTPDATGAVRFNDSKLPPGKVTLEATVTKDGLTGKCTATVTVNTAAPLCKLGSYTPKPVDLRSSKGAWGFSTKHDSDTKTAGVQTTIAVTTGSAVTDVAMVVGGRTITATPSGGTATFKDITLAEGSQTLAFTCTEKSTGNKATFNEKVLVDTTKPPKVTDLKCSVTQNRKGEVTCTWKSISDGAKGSGISDYLLHYRVDSAIDAKNFDATDTVKRKLKPATAGAIQAEIITGLSIPKKYYFGIVAVDRLGNRADLGVPATTPAQVAYSITEIRGAKGGDRFGFPVIAGDFNCDKLTDLAVGISGANAANGEVHLFFSSGAGLPTSFSKRIKGTTTAGRFGSQLAALDFNGDGCTDIAVRALTPSHKCNGAGRCFTGAVYVYLGQPVWADREDVRTGVGAELIFEPARTASTRTSVGAGISSADLDGDGADDLAMSYSVAGSTAAVLVGYGSKTIKKMATGVAPITKTVPAGADIEVRQASYEGGFGAFMGSGGRLDTDTDEELLIGSFFHRIGGKFAGAAYVVLGQKRATSRETVTIGSSTRVRAITGVPGTNVFFGSTVAAVGDLNGDGKREFAVADTAKDGNHGAVYLFNLPSGNITTTSAAAVITNDLKKGTAAQKNLFGKLIASGDAIDPVKGGDFDGDGLPDLIATTQFTGTTGAGAAHIFRFKKGAPLTNRKVSSANEVLRPPGIGTVTFGTSGLVFVKDINGDGFLDLAVGENGWDKKRGRVVVFK